MQPCPHARLHIRTRQLARQFMSCLPACTVSRHYNRRPDSDQLCNGAGDNRLKEAAREMESSNKCMYFVYTHQALRVSQDIDCPCMAAT